MWEILCGRKSAGTVMGFMVSDLCWLCYWLQDLQTFKEIKWEAVIVDECQSRSMNTNVALINVLQTNVRLLLFSSQLKVLFSF